MSGWISIHRKIREHWIYDERPYSKFQAWMDLLLSANHKDNKFLLGNELIEVERGSFITSELKLAEKWGWSRGKVRGFLSLLEDDGMVERKADNKKTTLTIVNYNDYQDNSETKSLQKAYEKTTKSLQKATNNNDNNDNNTICMYDERLKEVVSLLESNIGVIPPILIDHVSEYTDLFNLDMWIEATKIAANAKKRNVNYVLGVLRQWQDGNINTISDLEALRKEKEIEREEKKQNKQTYSKPVKKTRFHNFEQRSDKYSADQLEDIANKKRKEYMERMNRLREVDND